MDSRPEQLTPDAAMPVRQFLIGGLWIAVRLIAVFYLGQAGERFFYQNF